MSPPWRPCPSPPGVKALQTSGGPIWGFPALVCNGRLSLIAVSVSFTVVVFWSGILSLHQCVGSMLKQFLWKFWVRPSGWNVGLVFVAAIWRGMAYICISCSRKAQLHRWLTCPFTTGYASPCGTSFRRSAGVRGRGYKSRPRARAMYLLDRTREEVSPCSYLMRHLVWSLYGSHGDHRALWWKVFL
jgi:hypothetical protein